MGIGVIVVPVSQDRAAGIRLPARSGRRQHLIDCEGRRAATLTGHDAGLLSTLIHREGAIANMSAQG